MRIAIVTDWFAPRRGGVESQLAELAERLGASGDQVDVLTTTPGATNGRSFRTTSLDVTRLPGVDVAISPGLLRDLRQRLASGYDVVHAHVSVISPTGWAAVIAARSLGLPTVVTFHSVLLGSAVALRVADSVLNLSGSSIEWTAVSQLVARQLRVALRGDVSVLSNGIDVSEWTSNLSAPHGGPVTFVTAMRLHSKKRPRQLLRAFRDAVDGLAQPTKLVILGDGNLRSALERDVEAHRSRGNGEIELAGWMSRERVREIYARSDAFVLPSKRESFGIAALEARAAGLPVIAMQEAGSSEFLTHDDGAILCRDDDALTRALGEFATGKALRERMRSAHTDLSRYDWREVLPAHCAVYARAIMRAGAATRAVVA